MFEKLLVKYDGVLHEIPVNELDMDPAEATDAEVITAVERRGLPEGQVLEVGSLREFSVDRAETVMNLRPSAVFG